MSWRWINARNDRGYKKPSREEAIADAVGCAICMQHGLKPPASIDTPEPEIVRTIWAGLERAGWRIEEVA
jgi:hypothetical protein